MYTFSKEDLPQNQPRRQRRNSRAHGKSSASRKAVMALGLMLLLVIVGVWSNRASSAYAVFINGQETAFVESKSQGEKLIKEIIAKKSQEMGVSVTTEDKIEIKQVYAEQKDLVFSGDAEKKIEEKITLMAPGAVIVINGEKKLYLANRETAETLIAKVNKEYTPAGEDVKIIKSEIKEQLEIVDQKVPVAQIADADKAYQLLTVGTEELVTYIVKEGDSLWTIAHENNMSVDDLIAANPEIDPDKIGIDDELKLVKAEPMLHVTVTAQMKEVKVVPFETEVISDSTMLRGKSEVKQAGQDGEKEFEYSVVMVNGEVVDKQFLGAVVLAKPVNAVVKKGTKLVLASRSSGGSGQLRWPVRGLITSYYGYRGSEFHTGIDIDGKTGDAIRAAEGGTVVFVGRDGNYGLKIIINHGSGVKTLYAHLSSFQVSVGDEVDRGDVIGAMGSTGRSTGSHLHFEVLINGKQVNPIKYL